MIHQISLLNRLLADLIIQSISSKSYVNPHIVGKAKKSQPQKPQLKKIHFLGDLFIIGGGVFINRGKGLGSVGMNPVPLKETTSWMVFLDGSFHATHSCISCTDRKMVG